MPETSQTPRPEHIHFNKVSCAGRKSACCFVDANVNAPFKLVALIYPLIWTDSLPSQQFLWRSAWADTGRPSCVLGAFKFRYLPQDGESWDEDDDFPHEVMHDTSSEEEEEDEDPTPWKSQSHGKQHAPARAQSAYRDLRKIRRGSPH